MSRTFASPERRPASAGATPAHKPEAGLPFRAPDMDGSVGPVVQRKCEACAALGTKDNGPPSHPVLQRKCDACATENAAASAGFGFDLSKIPIHSPAPARASENLAMGLPGDRAEQEADRVAERVMRMPGLWPRALTEPVQPSPPGNIVQRLFARRDAEEAMLRRKLAPAAVSASSIPPIVRRVLGSQGQPLDPTARTFFEPRFGNDFSQVRIHADETAAESARSVNALAYTVGRDIVFGAGRYQPESGEGRKILAHELTHVRQQSLTGEARLQLKPAATGSMDAMEAAAVASVQAGDRLPQLQRHLLQTHWGSAADRRRYIRYFVAYHYRYYVGEELAPEIIAQQVEHFDAFWKDHQPRDRSASLVAGPRAVDNTRWTRTPPEGVMAREPSAPPRDMRPEREQGPPLQRKASDVDAYVAAAQGTEAARKGDSIAQLRSSVLFSHWRSAEMRREYTRAFLIEYHLITKGAAIEPDELNRWLVYFDQQLAEYTRQFAEQAEEARRRRAEAELAAEREQLIQEVMSELTLQSAQRLLGTDPRNYPVVIEHAALGELLGGDKLEMLVKFIPIVGEVVMLVEGVIGEEIFTGREIGAGERAFNILLSLLPVAGEILAAGKAGVRTLAAIVSRTRLSPRQLVTLLEGMSELDAEAVVLARKALEGGKLTVEEAKALREVARALDADGSFAARTALGAAQTPRIAKVADGVGGYWARNPGGPRSLQEAVEIARSRGVQIPEDIEFAASVKTKWKEGLFAEYATLGRKVATDELVDWEEFYNLYEKIPVRLNPVILESDEAIVAVISHEMHELNELRALFEARGGALTAGELHRLIQVGIKGNLHDQAWEVADELVRAMRGVR